MRVSSERFIRGRHARWEELERLLKRVGRRGVDRLSADEIERIGALYRIAAADLALAQRDYPNHDLTRYLNALVGRAHHLVYRGARIERRRIGHFFRAGFPRLVRRHLRYILVAALLLFVPWGVGWVLSARNPELAYTIAPQATDTLDFVERSGRLWIDIGADEGASSGAFIMTNNIQVSFFALAGGATAGLLTLYILLLNGLIFGAVFGFVQAHGLIDGLLEFVTAHAPLELTVICIAGGAGLRMGHAIIVPGLMRRRDALASAARDALGLVLGGAVLLIFAGLIEGFVSPSALPWSAKGATALISGALLLLYLALGGRNEDDGTRDWEVETVREE